MSILSRTRELLFQLLFAQSDADGAAVGAVLQVITGHDLFGDGEKLRFVILPAGLDGSFAGDRVQKFVPDSVLALFFAGKQVGGKGLGKCSLEMPNLCDIVGNEITL